MKSIRLLVFAVLILGLAFGAAANGICEPALPDAQAAAEAAEPRVLLYIVNQKDMKDADATFRAANAYLLMLGLLPGGTQLACATVGTDVGQPMRWLERADAAGLQALAAKTEGDIASMKNSAKTITDSMGKALGAATEAPNSQPQTFVLLHAQKYGLDAKLAEAIATAAQGQDVLYRLPTFSAATYRDEKRAAVIGAALGIAVMQEAPANGAQGAMYKLAPGEDGGYALSALADAEAILTGRFGAVIADAGVTPDAGSLSVALANLPTTGVHDARLLLLDVPAGYTLHLADAQGGAALAPDMTLTGSAKGLENRVYALPTQEGVALAPLLLTPPLAAADGAAQQAADAQPQTGGVTARVYYYMAAPPQTSAYLVDAVQRKNSPFRVGVAFEGDAAKKAFLDNQAFQEAFIRIRDENGPLCVDVPARYDAGSGILSAEAMLAKSGTYSVHSGVRNLVGARSETLGSEALSVSVQNALPLPADKSLTIDLLADAPFPMPQAGSLYNVNVRACFTDEDNAADTLTYRITQEPPENAAAIDPSAYYRAVAGLYSATIDAETGNMTVLSVADTLTQPLRQDTFCLVAYDDELAVGCLPVTVRLYSVQLALKELALEGLAHAQVAEEGDGAQLEAVRVRLPTAALPGVLAALVKEHLRAYACIVPAEEAATTIDDLRKNGAQLTWLAGDEWSGTLARPDANGDYAIEVAAELAGLADGATFTAEGWRLLEAEPSIAITNPAPKLLAAPRKLEQILMPLEGMLEPQPVTLDMAKLFQDRDDIPSLSYTARVLDETGAPIAFTALESPDGAQTWLLIGCTDAYVQRHALENGSAEITLPRAADTGRVLPVAVRERLTVEFGGDGACTVEVAATNIDSPATVFSLSIRTQDRVRLYLTLGLAGLAALLVVTLAAVCIARKRILRYANELVFTLHDPAIGERSVQISLPRWKKRRITLGELLLNGAMPCLTWLDQLERYVYIRPTRRGAVLVLRGRALEKATLMGGPEDAERKALLSTEKTAEITVNGNYQKRLEFRLLAVPETQPPTQANIGDTGAQPPAQANTGDTGAQPPAQASIGDTGAQPPTTL